MTTKRPKRKAVTSHQELGPGDEISADCGFVMKRDLPIWDGETENLWEGYNRGGREEQPHFE